MLALKSKLMDKGWRSIARKQPPGCVLNLAGIEPDNTTSVDYSDYANHGTITGASWVRLPSGLWVNSFDGTDDRIVCNSSFADVDMIAQVFSVSAWLLSTNTGGYKSFLGIKPATGANYGIAIFKDNADKVMINARRVDNAADSSLNWGQVLSINTWYHIIITHDGTGALADAKTKCWVNNVAQTAGAGVGDNWGIDANTIVLGRSQTTNYDWAGKLWLKMFNLVLSATQVAGIYQSERDFFNV
jgi:hypothetical protein